MKFPELITLLKSKGFLNKDVNCKANLHKHYREFYEFYAYNRPYGVTIRFIGDEKEVTYVQIINDITNEEFELTGDVYCDDFDTLL
jgi:hypothetical protein